MYVTEAVAAQLLPWSRPGRRASAHDLSDREFEVFRLLVAGRASTEIAGELHLSVKTVSTHKTRVLEKMSMANTAELVRYAVAQGLPRAQRRNFPSGHRSFPIRKFSVRRYRD